MLGGRDLAGTPTHKRGIGLMFQDFALFPHMDVAGNIAFGLRHGGYPKNERRVIASREMLDLVGTRRVRSGGRSSTFQAESASGSHWPERSRQALRC